jgi:hypothetical protein
VSARVNLVVEGKTEVRLVSAFLAPQLGECGVYLAPRAVRTSRSGRGGMTTFPRAKRDIEEWLAQDREAYVSTMFDLFRLPSDFPRWQEAEQARADPYRRAAILEEGLGEEIDSRMFIPYVQLHEFEALLFSDVETADLLLSTVSASRLKEMRAVRSAFETPEHINDGPATAPSKRLKALYPRYDKAAYGPLVASQIGLDVLCRQCRHFGEWIERLQALQSGGN